MRARLFTLFALAGAAGCGSEAPDDELNPIRAPDIPRIASAQDVLNGAHIPALDPATMNDAEISKVLGEGAFCAFRYVSDGKPVLAWKRQAGEPTGEAVVKLNGLLVPLQNQSGNGAVRFAANDIRLTMTSTADTRAERRDAQRPTPAKLIFEIDQKLRVGYGGYSACVP